MSNLLIELSFIDEKRDLTLFNISSAGRKHTTENIECNGYIVTLEQVLITPFTRVRNVIIMKSILSYNKIL